MADRELFTPNFKTGTCSASRIQASVEDRLKGGQQTLFLSRALTLGSDGEHECRLDALTQPAMSTHES